MNQLKIGGAIALLLCAGAADARPGQPLQWLLGAWRAESDGRWTTEAWRAGPGRTLVGQSATGRGDTVRERETMIIRFNAGKAAYFASPAGAPEVRFDEVARTPTSITFENPAHDYPQRIRYWVEGEGLTAEISLSDGSRPMRWNYRRARR